MKACILFLLLLSWPSGFAMAQVNRDKLIKDIERDGWRLNVSTYVSSATFRGPANFTGESLHRLMEFPRLEVLSLRGSSVNDDSLKHLWYLHGLREIDLSGTQITDAGLRHLCKFPRFESLDLSHTGVTGAGFLDLRRCVPGKLSLTGNRISRQGMKYLRLLRGLTSLSLAETNVTNDDVRELRHVTVLQEIRLDGAQISGDAALGDWAPPLPYLSKLQLQNTDVDDSLFMHFDKLPIWFESLNVVNTKVTIGGLQNLAAAARRAKEGGRGELAPMLSDLSVSANQMDDKTRAALEQAFSSINIHVMPE